MGILLSPGSDGGSSEIAGASFPAPSAIHVDELILSAQNTSSGVAAAEALVFKPAKIEVPEERVDPSQIELEITKLNQVAQALFGHFEQSYEALSSHGVSLQGSETNERSFLSESGETLEAIRTLIRDESYSARFAVQVYFDTRVGSLLSSTDSGFEGFRDQMRGYAYELSVIQQALLQRLSDGSSQDRYLAFRSLEHPIILITETLSPAEFGEICAIAFDKIAGIVFSAPEHMGHGALLLGRLNRPYLCGVSGTEAVQTGDKIVLDGPSGWLVIRPKDDTWSQYQREITSLTGGGEAPIELGAPRTRDGFDFHLRGSVCVAREPAELQERRVRGIGLVRTELLAVEDGRPMPLDRQIELYRTMLRDMSPSAVTVRTFDFAEDKRVLGIGSGVTQAQFDDQLRALFRAGRLVGNLELMFPMVNDLTDLDSVISSWDRIIAEQLAANSGWLNPKIPLGAMLETASGCMMAPSLVRNTRLDFICFGTRDLVNSVLMPGHQTGPDRKVAAPYHPAILQLIKQAVDAASEVEKPARMCGALAAKSYVPLLLGLGIKSAAFEPNEIEGANGLLRRCRLDECQELVRECLKFHSARQVLNALTDYIEGLPLIAESI